MDKLRWALRHAVVAGALAVAGCFDIEEGIELNRDLSGTATIRMAVDMEPFAYVSAKLDKVFADQPGEPSAEEVAAARQELLAQMEGEEAFDAEQVRASAGRSLPEGVSLIEAAFEQQDLKLEYKVKLAFDDIRKLQELDFEEPGAAPAEDEAVAEAREAAEGEAAGEGPENPLDKPFIGLTLVDEGETVLLTSLAPNPAEDAKKGEGESPEVSELVAQAMQGLRVAFWVKLPTEAVEHNATRVDGDTLFWEYDLDTLMKGAEAPTQIRVRFRK